MDYTAGAQPNDPLGRFEVEFNELAAEPDAGAVGRTDSFYEAEGDLQVEIEAEGEDTPIDEDVSAEDKAAIKKEKRDKKLNFLMKVGGVLMGVGAAVAFFAFPPLGLAVMGVGVAMIGVAALTTGICEGKEHGMKAGLKAGSIMLAKGIGVALASTACFLAGPVLGGILIGAHEELLLMGGLAGASALSVVGLLISQWFPSDEQQEMLEKQIQDSLVPFPQDPADGDADAGQREDAARRKDTLRQDALREEARREAIDEVADHRVDDGIEGET